MTTEAKLMAAAESACQQVGTERFLALTKQSLSLCGKEILPWMDESDQTGIFLPVDIVRDGKSLTGCVLTLQDRAVFAWVKGSFRVRNFEAVVPYSSITRTELAVKPSTLTSVALDMLHIEADESWTIIFDDVFEDGINMPTLLESILLGAATLDSSTQ